MKKVYGEALHNYTRRPDYERIRTHNRASLTHVQKCAIPPSGQLTARLGSRIDPGLDDDDDDHHHYHRRRYDQDEEEDENCKGLATRAHTHTF